MSHVDLIYKLNGDDAVINNGLNVFELAPILLSVGELIKESNKILFPEGKEVAVNVKPFREGSFIVDIVIFAKSNYQAILDYVNKDNIQQVKELLEWIGLISAGTTGVSVSLIKLIKFLKGKPKSIEKLSPNEVSYTDQNGNSIIVPKQTHALIQNCTIQNVFYNGFGKPIEIEGIQNIETYLAGNQANKSNFSKEDADFLKAYSESEIPILSTEEIVESLMNVYLVPKRGSFAGDGNKWSFHMKDSIVTANIKDEKFLKKCNDGEIKPHSSDVMFVELLQKIKKINGYLDPKSVSFEIIKVMDYQEGKSGSQSILEDF